MHSQVREYLTRIGRQFPEVYDAEKVLELGSMDMNGSPREYFLRAVDYVGIDWRPGKGVDEVCLAQDYKGRTPGYFNVVVSTEMLEHDPHRGETLRRAVELLRVGGHMLLTMAGVGRPPHETDVSPTVPNFYANVTAAELISLVGAHAEFERTFIEHRANPGDLYALFYSKKEIKNV